MIRNTTTPQAAPADIHEATAPLGNAGAILETLARSFSTDEPELSATLQVVLHEVYAGMERCQQFDIDTRKAQAAAASTAPDDHTRGNAIRAYCASLEEASLRLGGAAGTAEVLGCGFQHGSEYVLSDHAGSGMCEMLARELSALKELIHEVTSEASRIHRADIKAAAAAQMAAEQEAAE